MDSRDFSEWARTSQAASKYAGLPSVLSLTTIPGDVGIIGDLFQSSHESLQHCLTLQVKLSVAQRRTLKRAGQLLYLWGDNNNAADGTLDARLQGTPRLFQLVVKILRSLLQQIAFGKFVSI
jgi:hypothetical protein